MLYPVELRAPENMAGEQGFEPRYYGPEPHVLPLDDSPFFFCRPILFKGSLETSRGVRKSKTEGTAVPPLFLEQNSPAGPVNE